jgi:surface antigen
MPRLICFDQAVLRRRMRRRLAANRIECRVRGETLSLGDRMRRPHSLVVTSVIAIGLSIVSIRDIAVTALPSSVKFGAYLGAFNNVLVFSNGHSDYVSMKDNLVGTVNLGTKWQCVEYVRRFYLGSFGVDLSQFHRGDANTWFDSADRMKLRRFQNGGTAPPQGGDILASDGGSHGHLAIVRSVTPTEVCTVQQNFSNDALDLNRCLPLTATSGRYLVRSFDTNGTYAVRGWLRSASAADVCAIAVGQGGSTAYVSAFEAAYVAAGGRLALGCATGAIRADGFVSFAGSQGHFQSFDRGAIEFPFLRTAQAVAVLDPPRAKWSVLGLTSANPLGYPISGLSTVLSASTGTLFQFQRFEGGALEWHRTGAHAEQVFEVHGAIFQTWMRLGLASWAGGLPISDEQRAPTSPRGQIGRVSAFEGGHIWWRSGDVRAYSTSGRLDSAYMTLGGSGGWLGFPVSQESVIGGRPTTDFEGGYMTLSPTGAYQAFAGHRSNR